MEVRRESRGWSVTRRTDAANHELASRVLDSLLHEIDAHTLARVFLSSAARTHPLLANLHAAALAAIKGETMHAVQCVRRDCVRVSFWRDPTAFRCPQCGHLEGSTVP